ncbi:MAG: hypothetical protein DME19_09150 [Verrucomicrobia bacterium]|nr:MAG: hypothetical protein DME19_09150 [Verrucomicrobiota bacterium]
MRNGDPLHSNSQGSSHGILEEQLFLWCESCRHDWVEFAQRPENALLEDFPFDDGSAAGSKLRSLP